MYRAHLGVDFAAPIGTPVHATGNGVVSFAGRSGDYGNVVVIKHDYKYSTLYAHLSHFTKELYVGKVVHRGQIIGKVGNSGVSTGPHTHYEVRVYGVQHDPLTVKLPHLALTSKEDRAKFFTQTKSLLAKLESGYLRYAAKNIDASPKSSA
jgi:murein DD-endopeptidase MepM/ murein hydrolase activator NlpD